LEGIWRYNPGEKAGINDRISIIQRLLDLAALTCSRLMFPIPCKSLTEQHNANGDYGQSLSCDHLWRHYFYLSHPWLLIESNRKGYIPIFIIHTLDICIPGDIQYRDIDIIAYLGSKGQYYVLYALTQLLT
jgi:hypothetical protein